MSRMEGVPGVQHNRLMLDHKITYQKKGLCKKRDAVINAVDYLCSHVLGPNVERNDHEYWTDQKPNNSTSNSHYE